MKIGKLINKNRLDEITKTDDKGQIWIVGYKRKPGSGKAGQEMMLKKPFLKFPKIKVYIAGRYSRREEFCGYRCQLENLGCYTVVSRWLNGLHTIVAGSENDTPETRTSFAMDDWADLMAADLVVSFTEEPRSCLTRGGRHVEFGAAIAANKKCVIVGPRENVFHSLPGVNYFATWAEAFEDAQEFSKSRGGN